MITADTTAERVARLLFIDLSAPTALARLIRGAVGAARTDRDGAGKIAAALVRACGMESTNAQPMVEAALAWHARA